jgi:hypothetical protein
MVGIYLFILFSIIFGLPEFLDYLASQTSETAAIKAFKSIAFNFADVWQNIAFVAGMRWFIKIFLALLILVFISNEFSYLTIRSNILAGLSRTQFMLGKLSVVFLLSLIATIALFLSGLYQGYRFSASTDIGAILSRIHWLAYYFIETFTYLTFALLIGILIRKTGFAIITLLSYNFIEAIVQYYTPDQFDKYLPLNAMNGIIRGVNTSLLQIKTDDFDLNEFEFIQASASVWDIGLCLLYLLVFVGLIYLYLNKKDL